MQQQNKPLGGYDASAIAANIQEGLERQRLEDLKKKDMPWIDMKGQAGEKRQDEVKSPKHYDSGMGMDVIGMFYLTYGPKATQMALRFNILKYRMRAGSKPGVDAQNDLDKAAYYRQILDRLEDEHESLRENNEQPYAVTG